MLKSSKTEVVNKGYLVEKGVFSPSRRDVKWYGSKDWADEQVRYLPGLLSDNSTWNLSHNWHFKRLVAQLIIGRLKEAGFAWHFKVASGHFHRWLKRKSWGARV